MNRLQILEEVYGEVVWSESALTHLTEVMKKVREQTLDEVYCVIENEQERYCNLTNGSGQDYNDFIDCLENLKETLKEDVK